MPIRVTINKEPLYGKVFWDGNNFVYTPDAGFSGKDYYVYTISDGTTNTTNINYVDSVNTAPLASNISLTALASDTVRINVNDYISDTDNLVGPLKLIEISPTTFGTSFIDQNYIVYQSRGYNSTEIFKYTVSDGQYTASGNVNIKIINGADTTVPQNILDDLSDLTVGLNIFSNASANWDSSYTLLCAKSASWNQIDTSRFNNVATTVENNSANWNQVAIEKPSYDAARNIVISTSASWNDVRDKITTVTNIFSANSGKWNDSETILQTNSADWITNVSNVSSLSSDYYFNKPIWNSAVNTVSSLSSSWDKTNLTNTIYSNSANWESSYTLLCSNSAEWDSSVTEINSLNNTYNTKFSDWNSALTTVTNNSAVNWDNTNLLNTISTGSANWDNGYTILSTSSADWENNYTVLNDLSTSYVSKSGNWDSAYTTVNTYSADWDKSSIVSFLSSNSGNWEIAYTTVNTYSADWNNNVSLVSGLSTSFANSSGNWESTYNTICANSAKWDYTTVSSKIENTSANWDTSYTLVCANSTTWNSVSSVYGKYDVAYNTLTGTSANWQNSFTVLTGNSAKWSDTYTTVQSNSSKWLTGGGDVNLLANNLTISGNAVIVGNLTAQGGISQTTTSVVSTSAFDVVNIGDTNALQVTKTQTTGAIATFNSGASPVLYISPLNKVGINTDSPNEALTVVGNISASGTIYGTVPAEYTVFKNNSARYEASDTYFSTLCGLLTSKPSYDSAFSFVSGISSNLNNFVNLSAPLYNAAYSVVTAQSANNNSSYNTLCSISASFGIDTQFRANSANYTTAYNYVSSTSAAWVTNNPTFTTLKTTTLTSGNVYLTNALLTSISTPVTASEEFLSIKVNGQDVLVQLWNA
jgi:hypothetical protein